MRARFRRAVVLPALVALAAAGPPAVAESLTLRVNDAEALPGGIAALVLRTYASRPISQGQICLRVAAASFAKGSKAGPELLGPTLPIAAFSSSVVFSSAADAEPVLDAELGVEPQTLLVSFSSPSASVNDVDGPLAVLFVELDPAVVPGEEYEIAVDFGATFLVDDDGQPVPLEPRSGTLSIRASGEPSALSVSREEAPAGAVAEVAVATAEIFPIGSGVVELVYDPALLAAPPEVAMDPRYGSSVHAAAHPPGRSIVTFESPDGSLNEVPGDFLVLRLQIAADLPVGSVFPVVPSPGTLLLDPAGQPVPLALESGAVTILPVPEIFADGFESGDLGAWTVP